MAVRVWLWGSGFAVYGRDRRRIGAFSVTLAAILAVGGTLLVVVALHHGGGAPQPPLAEESGNAQSTSGGSAFSYRGARTGTAPVPSGARGAVPPEQPIAPGMPSASGRSIITTTQIEEQSPPELTVPQTSEPSRTATETSGPPTFGAGTPPKAHGPVMPRSIPVSITIPAIGVQSKLLQLGLNPDGTVQVPPLDAQPSEAGWYRYSPTPGELGPAIILGHVDSAANGPAVFFRLGALSPGDSVEVARSDGSTAVFRVTRDVRYPKANFPTSDVYGDIDIAGLRLITCGGSFDFSTRHYEDDIVVYAKLVGARH